MRNIAIVAPEKQGKSSLIMLIVHLFSRIPAETLLDLGLGDLLHISPEVARGDIRRLRVRPGGQSFRVEIDGVVHELGPENREAVLEKARAASTFVLEIPLDPAVALPGGEPLEFQDFPGDGRERHSLKLLDPGNAVDFVILVGRFGYAGVLETARNVKEWLGAYPPDALPPVLGVVTFADAAQVNPRLNGDSVSDMLDVVRQIHPRVPLVFCSPLVGLHGAEGNFSPVTRDSLGDLAVAVEEGVGEEIRGFAGSPDGGAEAFLGRLLGISRRIPLFRQVRGLAQKAQGLQRRWEKIMAEGEALFGRTAGERAASLVRAARERREVRPGPVPRMGDWREGPPEWKDDVRLNRQCRSWARGWHPAELGGLDHVAARMATALRATRGDVAQARLRMEPFLREAAIQRAIAAAERPAAEVAAEAGLAVGTGPHVLGARALARPIADADLEREVGAAPAAEAFEAAAGLARNGAERAWLEKFRQSRGLTAEIDRLRDLMRIPIEELEK